MGTTEIIEPRVTNEPEPELHLLVPTSTFDESLLKSLFGNINDFFFPKKQAPLVLTSKPIPVADIWGFYNYKKNGVFGSTVVHILIVLLIIVGTIVAPIGEGVSKPPTQEMTLIRPDDVPILPPSKTKVGGGGGGGDRDKLQAVKGKLPKTAMEQITPPAVIVRNEHPKLAVEPTVVVPPQIKMASNMPNIGDPMSHLAVRSSIERNWLGSRYWGWLWWWRRCWRWPRRRGWPWRRGWAVACSAYGWRGFSSEGNVCAGSRIL